MTPEQRSQVVELARLWLNTPYHHMGRVRGSGADCAMFPLAVYEEAGVVRPLSVEGAPGATAPYDVEWYPLDWHFHRSVERYLEIVQQLADEHSGPPMPGDFVLFKFGHAFSHGAIVVEWPLCVHAHMHRGVVYVDVLQDPKLGRKVKRGEVRFFTAKGC